MKNGMHSPLMLFFLLDGYVDEAQFSWIMLPVMHERPLLQIKLLSYVYDEGVVWTYTLAAFVYLYYLW